MKEKETILTQSEDVVSNVVETGKCSTLRPWLKPAFARIPLNDALSGLGQGADGGFRS
jgi:hypothetical protein